MNTWITTPSMLRNRHGYSEVEGAKYFNAFTRRPDDPLAAGFKFGYWGSSEFNPDNIHLKPLRTCVGEVGANTKLSYVSPPSTSYAQTVRSPRSKSNTRGRRQRLATSKSPRGRSASPGSVGRFAEDTVSSRNRAAATIGDGDVDGDGDVPMEDLEESRTVRPSLAQRVQSLRQANAAAENKLDIERSARKRAEKALAVERDSRRILLAECAEERHTRMELEAGLSNASVALERARARIKALATQNDTLRRENSSALVDEANAKWQRAVQQLEAAAHVKAELKDELAKERSLRRNLQDLLAEAEDARKAAEESARLADVARELAETARSKAQAEAAVHRKDKDKLADRLSTAISRIEALERKLVGTAKSPRRRPTKSASPPLGHPASPYYGYMPSGTCSKTPSPPPASRTLAASPSSVTSKSSRTSKGRKKTSKKSSRKAKADPNPTYLVSMKGVETAEKHPLLFSALATHDGTTVEDL